MAISQPIRRRPRSRTATVGEIVVVIPARDERDRLPRCLDSVAAAAELVAVPVTVVVVLDACTDHSEDVIPRWAQVLSVSARNVGAARAAGFVAAAPTADPGIWLATTDADCVVPETWMARHLTHHAAAVEGAVGTVMVEWIEHSAATRRRYDRLYRAGEAAHDHVHGANLGFRADAYWRVGGFRPLHVGEDVDLVQRLLSAGAPLVWDTDNAVLTSDRCDFRAAGGFGDYVRSLADEPRNSASVTDTA
jgi:glycosyltransferase involved in cell wall biosynthesis